MIGIHRLLEIRQVAARTSRGQARVLSDRRILVAQLAFHNSVGSQQGKPVEMIYDRLRGDIPSQWSVACGAIRAHLSAVNVRVAIRAILANICEDRFGVAFGAAHFFMHSA